MTRAPRPRFADPLPDERGEGTELLLPRIVARREDFKTQIPLPACRGEGGAKRRVRGCSNHATPHPASLRSATFSPTSGEKDLKHENAPFGLRAKPALRSFRFASLTVRACEEI